MLVEGNMTRIVSLVIGLGLAAGCGGGTLGGGVADGGPDAAAPNNAACSTLDECACYAAIDRCQPQVEACWCPDMCAPIDCICGGGRFLGCEVKAATTTMTCSVEAARVQQACAGNQYVGLIAEQCSSRYPTCVADCLANLGSCDEINCYLCELCDCAGPPTPSALNICISNCNSLD